MELSYRHAKESSTIHRPVSSKQLDVARVVLVASGQRCGPWPALRLLLLLLAASSRFWPDKVIVAPWRHLINGAGIRATTTTTTTAVACCMWQWQRQSRVERYDTSARACCRHNE